MDETERLNEYLQSGSYLPGFMRDFHDQKKIFKDMHIAYAGNSAHKGMPSWNIGHQYVIDWFLWCMASRGYSLQRIRKRDVKFIDINNKGGE